MGLLLTMRVMVRAIETVIRVILRSTVDFDIDGPLQHSRMPELGIISCPLRFVTSLDEAAA